MIHLEIEATYQRYSVFLCVSLELIIPQLQSLRFILNICSYRSVYLTCIQLSVERESAEEITIVPGAGVIRGCKPPNMGAEN